jgi:hypothetical protein
MRLLELIKQQYWKLDEVEFSLGSLSNNEGLVSESYLEESNQLHFY